MDHIPPFLRLGRVVEAGYVEQELWAYKNVPTNEALGRILSRKEAAMYLAQRPPFEEAMRAASPEVRLEMIQAAMLEWFEPLPFHLDLHESISRALRGSLPYRNPLARTYYRDAAEQLDQFWTPPRTYQRSSALGFQLTGVSGAGKTSAIERELGLYAQWIKHTHYKNKPFHFDQLTWLHMDCPHDVSVRGLCLNFLQAVDAIFPHKKKEETYMHLYGGRRATVDYLIPAIATIAANHCLGLLVIDEIQRLALAKSGGAERMLSFFVQLVNTIGVPVILVGTYKARAILEREFAQIRRGSGQGEKEWDRMERGSQNWSHFIKAMWKFQFVKHPEELTAELSNTLYEETQGITDYAIKVFSMAQWRAITTGRERITPAMIRSVAKDGLKSAQNVLRALREGKAKAVIGQLEDVLPPDIRQLFIEEERALRKKATRVTAPSKETVGTLPPTDQQKESPLNPTTKDKKKERTRNEASPQENLSHGLTSGLGDQDKYSGDTPTQQHTVENQEHPEPTLIDIVERGKNNGVSPIHAFAEAGLAYMLEP